MSEQWELLNCASLTQAIFQGGELIAVADDLDTARQTAVHYINENFGQLLSRPRVMVDDDGEWDGLAFKYRGGDNQIYYVRISRAEEVGNYENADNRKP